MATVLNSIGYRTFLSLQKFLLDSTTLGFLLGIQPFLFFFYLIHCDMEIAKEVSQNLYSFIQHT